LERFADAGRALLVGSAAAAPLIRREWRAAANASAVLFAVSTSVKIKMFWREPRPDGEDLQSFPSEHAADGFAPAAIIGREFAGGVGLAAFGLATAISLARVGSGKHHLADVIAGGGMDWRLLSA
jgi:membrane-associated phospholipid phosphatase